MKPLIIAIAISATAAALTSAQNTSAIPDSPSTIHPILIGATLPELDLQRPDGTTIQLSTILKAKPTALIFYRGGWCPYCTQQLGQLQTIEKKLVALGYQVIALSPDSPQNLVKAADPESSTLVLLSDSDLAAARAFGVAYRVDQPMLKKLASYKIDIEAASGKKHHLLPVPSVFLVNTNQTVEFTYVNPDYRIRLHPEVLLAAASAISKTQP